MRAAFEGGPVGPAPGWPAAGPALLSGRFPHDGFAPLPCTDGGADELCAEPLGPLLPPLTDPPGATGEGGTEALAAAPFGRELLPGGAAPGACAPANPFAGAALCAAYSRWERICTLASSS